MHRTWKEALLSLPVELTTKILDSSLPFSLCADVYYVHYLKSVSTIDAAFCHFSGTLSTQPMF